MPAAYEPRQGSSLVADCMHELGLSAPQLAFYFTKGFNTAPDNEFAEMRRQVGAAVEARQKNLPADELGRKVEHLATAIPPKFSKSAEWRESVYPCDHLKNSQSDMVENRVREAVLNINEACQ